ncbi:hypothetical protein [Halococcoides cellulosivorans]|uniref:Uncharacterized protein n=1 Tax=Halococcoides cellulosivorans TaxID=1679096 RepID=A0A2R4WZA7_9EURY|nr:hypothetical protein [Halococcoides cellulosivorans]AWB26883.1 hypothetical protein HARCEL1_03720 [Halococcoides cellulosivorans]
MTTITPADVPTYETRAEGRSLWTDLADQSRPTIAIRNGERGFVVRYDLAHLDRSLTEDALRTLRARLRERRAPAGGLDPISESVGLGGEMGQIAGEIHADTDAAARDLAVEIAGLVTDSDNWA